MTNRRPLSLPLNSQVKSQRSVQVGLISSSGTTGRNGIPLATKSTQAGNCRGGRCSDANPSGLRGGKARNRCCSNADTPIPETPTSDRGQTYRAHEVQV